MSVVLEACVQAASVNDRPIAIDATFVDPDGVAVTIVGATVHGYDMSGDSCSATTWYQSVGGDPQVDLLLAIPNSGADAMLDVDMVVAHWKPDASADWRALLGGQLTIVADEPDLLHVEVDSGQDCTVADPENVCSAQSGTASVELSGQMSELVEDVIGSTPSASTDASTGDALCAGVLPGL